MSDDRQIEVGLIAPCRPQWWWTHTEEFDEAMSVAASWDEQVQIARRLPADEQQDIEAKTPRRLTVTDRFAGERSADPEQLASFLDRRGDIPSIRVGRRTFVPHAQLERLVGGDPISSNE